MSTKISAGAAMPEFELPKVGGGSVKIGGKRDAYQMVVVYRGKHCPVCKSYLKGLEGLQDKFRSVKTEIVAVSADPVEKAESEAKEEGWTFPVGHSLSVDQMRALGLYVSAPRSPQETDRPFSEPGLFVVNPDGKVQIVDISNAPWVRPELGAVAAGVGRLQELNYPIRGTLE
ncbi:MAG: redoxin domain-containing protein [Alphaproteobacteria bacterium]